jgi:hypothetical protein
LVLTASLLAAGLVFGNAYASTGKPESGPTKKPDKVIKTKKSDSAKAKKPAKVTRAKKSTKKGKHTKKVIITGSYIPFEVEPGKPVVTGSPVVVVRTDTFRRMGAPTVGHALGKLPMFR